MQDLFKEAISGFNLPFTILLGCMLLYWLVALVGLLDFEFLDGLFGLDTEVDADLEIEAGEGDDGGGVFQSLLHFLNATDIPVMFVLSLLVLFLWAGNLAGNYYLNRAESGLIGGVIVLAALVTSVFLTKAATQPLKPVAQMLKSKEGQAPVVGREGIVRSPEITPEFGQVEVETKGGAPLLLHARLSPEHEKLSRGAHVLVVAVDEGGNWYTVRPLKPTTEEST